MFIMVHVINKFIISDISRVVYCKIFLITHMSGRAHSLPDLKLLPKSIDVNHLSADTYLET